MKYFIMIFIYDKSPCKYSAPAPPAPSRGPKSKRALRCAAPTGAGPAPARRCTRLAQTADLNSPRRGGARGRRERGVWKVEVCKVEVCKVDIWKVEVWKVEVWKVEVRKVEVWKNEVREVYVSGGFQAFPRGFWTNPGRWRETIDMLVCGSIGTPKSMFTRSLARGWAFLVFHRKWGF